jgi:hypothetical protein
MPPRREPVDGGGAHPPPRGRIFTESLAARGRQLAAMAPDADFVDIVLETDGKALDELATELLAKLGWID